MATCKACGQDVLKARDTDGEITWMDPERTRVSIVGNRWWSSNLPQVEMLDHHTYHRDTCKAGGLFPASIAGPAVAGPPVSSEEARERRETRGDPA